MRLSLLPAKAGWLGRRQRFVVGSSGCTRTLAEVPFQAFLAFTHEPIQPAFALYHRRRYGLSEPGPAAQVLAGLDL